jgi:4-hydroxy-3-methylbut-2-enyl diphosphate reductase
MIVNIDSNAGYCWGVVRTIDIAEDTLKEKNNEDVNVLGHIIHNPREIDRLAHKGLKTISHNDLENMTPGSNVIIRAHGEPPSTYEKAKEKGINIIDATCPLVTALQNRVIKYYNLGYQIVIFGKHEHAEVIGLRGVCNDEAIVIRSVEEAEQIVDFNKKTVLISQTTMDKQVFQHVKSVLEEKINTLIDAGVIDEKLLARDTTCRAVTHREEPMKEFATQNDVMIFVSGRRSSNGKGLFKSTKEVNPNTYFIESIEEINWDWFDGAEKVGISGATSTPQWYMQKVKKIIEEKFNVLEPIAG